VSIASNVSSFGSTPLDPRRERSLSARGAVALAAFRRTVAASRGYREYLESIGVAPDAVQRFEDVPYIDKTVVYGDDVAPWLEGGRTTDAAELLTSSGHGGSFSVGVTSRAELIAQQAMTDAALRGMGASEYTTTLLLNCLPMGITVPTTLATIASPSVHVEMAQEIYERLGPDFDRIVILSDPLFLKELAERLLDERSPEHLTARTACMVGGEWVSESWRRYVSGIFDMPPPERQGASGILVSMGAAELGLNLLFETPELRVARAVLDTPGSREALFGRDPGYTPSLFTYDPERVHIEAREHADGTRTLACTTLIRRLLPLVRYDLGDLGEPLDEHKVNAELAVRGVDLRLSEPVIAVWGRAGSELSGLGWSVRPELIKQRLFANPAEAATLTGRFYLEESDGLPLLHVQLREGTRPTPRLAADLGAYLSTVVGVTSRVSVHQFRDYPYHLPGDFQHKTLYRARPHDLG
jgi:phenylacetate-CoA ligase